jgi:protein TonB
MDFTLHDLPGPSKTNVVVTASKITPVKQTPRKAPDALQMSEKGIHEITPGAEKAVLSSPPQEFPGQTAEEPVLSESAKQVHRNALPANDTDSFSDARIPVSNEHFAEMTHNKGTAGLYASAYVGESGYIRNHFAYIRDMIQKKATYPLYARKRGWEGKVSVSFVISPEGNVSNVSISKSSGKNLLDKSALDAVRKASPFPPPPIHAMIKIPVIYRLHDP